MNIDTFAGDVVTIFGKSSDTKPTPDFNDEKFRGHMIWYFCIDNGKLFAYDYSNKSWIEQ